MAKHKYYTIWAGHEVGVFEEWSEVQRHIAGYPNPLFKGFSSQEEALRAYEDGYGAYSKRAGAWAHSPGEKPIIPALCVDAACSGNPGPMEYRGVLLGEHREIFHIGPLAGGTNNIGEFLAIVHALALSKQQGWSYPIYTDSMTALKWVQNKYCKTLIAKTEENKPLFELIARAEIWLKSNTYTTPIYKWDTRQWGEIPADFGRK